MLLCSSRVSHSNTAVIEQGIIHSCPVPPQTPGIEEQCEELAEHLHLKRCHFLLITSVMPL